MLSVLKIRNIAVIESAEIEFFRGFNVLTGETGAGKSIILDSINAVLGFRTSRELIRTGETQAEVTALFCDIDASSEKALSCRQARRYKKDAFRGPEARGYPADRELL